MLNMQLNLLNDWKLLGFNIRAIFRNQRMANFPYFLAVIGIIAECLFANTLLITGVVEELGYKGIFSGNERITFHSNYTLPENGFIILTIVVNAIFAIALSECVRRRINDYSGKGWGRCGQLLTLIIMSGIIIMWSSLQHIDMVHLEATLQLYVYLFYTYVAFLLLTLLPSSPQNNSYGLANGAQIQAGLAIEFESIIPKKENKKEDELDRIGLSSALDNSKTVFIDKIFDFTGRAKRGELYWGVFVFQLITSMLGQLLIPIYDVIPNINLILPISLIIYYIAYAWYCLGNLSSSVRRLHDTGRSGYWMLGMFLPLVNIYVSYLLTCKPSIRSMHEYNSDKN